MVEPMHRNYENAKAETISLLDFHKMPSAVSLVEAVAAAHDEAERCTANDVATRPGYLRWATPFRYLGDEYVPKGWKRERPGGYELLVSPDGKRAIAVAQGDFATGTQNMPSTLIERGPLTAQAVSGNKNQMRFSAEVHPDFAPDIDPELVTWLLLSHHDRSANEIRIELSKPVEFTKSPGAQGEKNRGHVTRFDPRIILPAISLEPIAVIDDEHSEPAPIEVPVQRRSDS
jgi:hypothetical protein